MNLSIYYGDSLSNTNTLLETFSNIGNSTQHSLFYNVTRRGNNYYWRLQADDGTNYVNETLTFKTEYGDVGAIYPINTTAYSLIGILGILGLIALFRKKKKEKEEN